MNINISAHTVAPRSAAGIPNRGSSPRAFSLIEVLVSITLSAISLTTFYASAGQAIRIVKSGKDTANASQLLQQRIEVFRSTPQWTKVTTPTGIAALMTPMADSAVNIPGPTETVTVNSYPTPGTPIVVTRTAAGAITRSGANLDTQKCVKLTIRVTQTVSGRTRARELSTILTKGGL